MKLTCPNNHKFYSEPVNTACPACMEICECISMSDIAERNWQWVERMGWHNKTPLEALALIASEVGEAVNECRGKNPTDNFAEELADIFLRLSDLAHDQGVDLQAQVLRKMGINESRGTRGRLK